MLQQISHEIKASSFISPWIITRANLAAGFVLLVHTYLHQVTTR